MALGLSPCVGGEWSKVRAGKPCPLHWEPGIPAGLGLWGRPEGEQLQEQGVCGGAAGTGQTWACAQVHCRPEPALTGMLSLLPLKGHCAVTTIGPEGGVVADPCDMGCGVHLFSLRGMAETGAPVTGAEGLLRELSSTWVGSLGRPWVLSLTLAPLLSLFTNCL